MFFWIIICLLVAHSAAQTQTVDKDEVYGVKSTSNISVRITGGGVRHPGIYFIKTGATLHDLIANDKAVWLKSSNGTFRISRCVKGEKVTLKIDYHQWDIKLLDGDDIYAPDMRMENTPNKIVDPTR